MGVQIFLIWPKGRFYVGASKGAIDAGLISIIEEARELVVIYGIDPGGILAGCMTDSVLDLHTAAVIVPGQHLFVADEEALRLDGPCADITDDLLRGIGETVEVARIGRRLDAEDRADVLGIVLHLGPPIEGCFCNGVLMDQDAVFDGDLLGIQGDVHHLGFVDNGFG